MDTLASITASVYGMLCVGCVHCISTILIPHVIVATESDIIVYMKDAIVERYRLDCVCFIGFIALVGIISVL